MHPDTTDNCTRTDAAALDCAAHLTHTDAAGNFTVTDAATNVTHADAASNSTLTDATAIDKVANFTQSDSADICAANMTQTNAAPNFTRYDSCTNTTVDFNDAVADFTRSGAAGSDEAAVSNITRTDTATYFTHTDTTDFSYTDSAIGTSIHTSSSSACNTKRSDSATASCSTTIDYPSSSLHSPSCSHDVFTTLESSETKPSKVQGASIKSRKTKPKTAPKRDVTASNYYSTSRASASNKNLESTKAEASNITELQSYSSSDVSHVIASISECNRVLSGHVSGRVSVASTSPASRREASSVASGIATVSGAALDARQPPPVPARVFACITEETLQRKPKRKNFRPSPPQQRR